MSGVTMSPLLRDDPIGVDTGDLLGFSPLAHQIDLALSGLEGAGNGMVVALEGAWGSGKTSLLNLVRRRLEARSADRIVTVEVSAWLSLPAEGMVEALSARLAQAWYERLRGRVRGTTTVDLRSSPLVRPPAPVPIDLSGHSPVDRRISWVELARRASEAVPLEDWDPCLRLYGGAASRIRGRDSAPERATELVSGSVETGATALAAAHWPGVRSVLATTRAASGLVRSVANALTRTRDEAGLPQPGSSEFTAALGRLGRMLAGMDQAPWHTLLIIDDASRLDPERLSALAMALADLRNLDGVLTLVCLDHRLTASLLSGSAADGAFGRGEDGLTKVIALRWGVPRTTGHEEAYVATLARAIGLTGSQNFDGFAAQLSGRMAGLGYRTPRQVKAALRIAWSRLNGGLLDDVRRKNPSDVGAQFALIWLVVLLVRIDEPGDDDVHTLAVQRLVSVLDAPESEGLIDGLTLDPTTGTPWWWGGAPDAPSIHRAWVRLGLLRFAYGSVSNPERVRALSVTDEALKALLLNGQDVTALTGVIRASHALNDYSDLSKYRYLAAAMRALLVVVG